MGEIMEFSSDKVLIKRMNFGKKDSVTGAYGVEEKADMRWELPIPLTKDKFTYTTAQKENTNSAPVMVEGSGSFRIEENNTYLTFTAGSDDDFVHSYKLVFNNGSKSIETYYFTDFINGIADMKNIVELQVYSVPAGTYNVTIYAVDSYGKVSSNFTTISNVQINTLVKYK